MIHSHFARPGLILLVSLSLSALRAADAPAPVNTTPKLEILNRQIKENAEDAKAFSNRGYTLALLGRKDEARADLKRALELDNKAPMLNRVGWALFNLGDYAQAVRQFEAAAELSGHQAHYDYYSLVLGYWGTGDTRRALENYDLAVKRDPRLGENEPPLFVVVRSVLIVCMFVHAREMTLSSLLKNLNRCAMRTSLHV